MKLQSIVKPYNAIFNTLDYWLSPLWFLGVRYWLASVFFSSGLVSISDWENNLNLFRFEFNVPIVSPEFAAILSTAVEIIAPPMLLLGFGTRFAALAILASTIVIEVTYAHYDEHIVWMFASALLVLKGAEKISADHLLAKRLTI